MPGILKNIKLTSVDLVRAGANQEADICLYKSDTPPLQGGSILPEKRKDECNMNDKTKIDKSLLTADELEQYEALIAKATVPDDEPEEKPEPDNPPPENPGKPRKKVEKSTRKLPSDNAEKPSEKPFIPEHNPVAKSETPEIVPDFTAALERLDRLEKSIEVSQMATVAKKYAVLGEDEYKLAETLYNLKKSDEKNYNAYIAVLDKSVDIVEKSGLFTEIGKSGRGSAGGSVLDKIDSAASEIQKADPSINRVTAIAKAWENHPELAIEYNSEYNAR